MKKLIAILGLAVLAAGCSSNATVISKNLSVAADMFELERRVVFYNGITDEYMLTIEGRCSVYADNLDKQLEVVCAIGPDAYKKHFLGLSDNISYVVEQLETAKANAYHYRVLFKPQSLVPNFDLETGPVNVLE